MRVCIIGEHSAAFCMQCSGTREHVGGSVCFGSLEEV